MLLPRFVGIDNCGTSSNPGLHTCSINGYSLSYLNISITVLTADIFHSKLGAKFNVYYNNRYRYLSLYRHPVLLKERDNKF